MSDYRDVAAQFRGVLVDVDSKRMVGYFEDGDGERHAVRLHFEVCGTCNGRGSYVNPSIDSHGLSREDFDDDPDFAEDYFRGVYDVACNECGGARVVPAIDRGDGNPEWLIKAIDEAERDAWQYARECVREREMGY